MLDHNEVHGKTRRLVNVMREVCYQRGLYRISNAILLQFRGKFYNQAIELEVTEREQRLL